MVGVWRLAQVGRDFNYFNCLGFPIIELVEIIETGTSGKPESRIPNISIIEIIEIGPIFLHYLIYLGSQNN